MRTLLTTAGALLMFAVPASLSLAAPDKVLTAKPTIVLVHGAFADSSSWNGVTADLVRDGYTVIAAANPLRGVKSDADYVARLTDSIAGPVVLVGHSYGGEVISVAANGRTNVKALVFVAAFAPEIGESAASLSASFPTGTLGSTLAPPVLLSDGSSDLYIDRAKYRVQFAADVPQKDVTGMAAAQRPIAQSALAEPVTAASWHSLPSWFVWGSKDKNIPNTLALFMANRAQAREAVEIPGASHVVMISHPHAISAMIERAATSG